VASRENGWLDDRVDVLLAALADYGMNASRSAASDLIRERVSWVAAQSGIRPAAARRYLTDEALRSLARTMTLAVADEAPGADVLGSPRTAAVPVAVLGRAVAGLSEAILIRQRERDDLSHVRAITAQLAHTVSALGQVISETGEPATSSASVVMGTSGATEPGRSLPGGRRLSRPRRKSSAGEF
jgi:hypothetical protein